MNKYNIIPSVLLASLGLCAHAEEGGVKEVLQSREVIVRRNSKQVFVILKEHISKSLSISKSHSKLQSSLMDESEQLEQKEERKSDLPGEEKKETEQDNSGQEETKSNDEIGRAEEEKELEGAPISVKTRVIDHFVARLNGKPAGEIVENPFENPEKKPSVLPPSEPPPAPAAAAEQPAEEQAAEDSGLSMGYSWIISLIFVLAALGVLYYTRRVQESEAHAAGAKDGEEKAASPEPEKEVVAPVKENPHDAQMQKMMALSKTANDVNLEGLLLDRLEDIKAAYGDTQKWAIECIGLIDEIRVMRNAYKGNDGDILDAINSILRAQLADRDCEVLNSDTWNPDIQRAIKIDRVLPKGSPKTIVAKYASGLKIAGSLIRKQEVVLEQEKPDDL